MLKGIAVSEGIAQGIAFCIDADRNKENCEDSYRKAESKDEESARFQEAMTAFLEETERAACDLEAWHVRRSGNITQSYGNDKRSFCHSENQKKEIDNGCCAEGQSTKTMKFSQISLKRQVMN